MKIIEAGYKFHWKKRKVKDNPNNELKCSKCEHIFKINEWAYIYYNRWNSIFIDVKCENCYRE